MKDKNSRQRFSLIGHLSFGTAHAAMAAIVLMMVLISFEVFIRKIFGLSTKVAHDLSGFFLVAVTFLGAAETLRTGKHLRVKILFDRLGAKARSGLEIMNLVVAFGLVAILLWATGRLVVDSYVKNTLTDGAVQFPEYVPQLLMPIGLALLLLQIVEKLYTFFRK